MEGYRFRRQRTLTGSGAPDVLYFGEIEMDENFWMECIEESLQKPSRAQIAMRLMAGMMANSEWEPGDRYIKDMARLAVVGADALLAALKKDF